MPVTMKAFNAALERYDKRVDELTAALTLALTTKPDAVEKVRDGAVSEAGRYTLSLYGATRAHGGIVVVRFDCPGQLPSVSARYFDEYRTEYAVLAHVSFAIACERLSITRQRLLDTKGPFRPGGK